MNTPAVVDVLKSIYAQLGANDVANIPKAAEMIEKITEAAESGRSLTKGDTTMTINTIAEALKKLYAKLGGTDNVADVPTVAEMIDKVTEVAGTGGGGGSDTVIVTETDDTLNITPNQLKAALAEGKRVVMYYENAEGGVYAQKFLSTIMQNADNEIHTFSYTIAFYEGGAQIEAAQYYTSEGGDDPFVVD